MFEARLLIDYKDFINRVGKGKTYFIQGVIGVSEDYLNQWSKLKSGSQTIKSKEVIEFNQLIDNIELPQVNRPCSSLCFIVGCLVEKTLVWAFFFVPKGLDSKVKSIVMDMIHF